MSIQNNIIYKHLLNWGVILLAISITFSISLMNVAFALLSIALIIRIFKREVKFIPTGLEIPLAVFLGFYLLSSILSPDPGKSIKGVMDDYWYILHMYIVIYLFDEKAIKKFMVFLGWAAVGLGIYTVLQSFAGLNFNLNFHLSQNFKMVAPVLSKITDIKGHPIYLGTGLMGQHRTFGGQILMLLFFTYGVFREKWKIAVTLMALVLTFIFNVWIGFLVAALLIFSLKKKKISYMVILAGFLLLMLAYGIYLHKDNGISWGNIINICKSIPIIGNGSGANGSVYSNILIEGGLLAFGGFLFLIIKFFIKYFNLPSESKGKWKRMHTGCLLGVAGILIAGLCRNYLTDAQNAVLFWTLMGLVVKIKLSKWSLPMYIYSDYEDIELFI
jgi:hypothetical protein